ncbi:hypothetical protein BDP27DRAFT_1331320 [Rhodocollybia butyracea]|uniref:Uncharacterized protein n=1 Tax=Rhodocollybia butyracea TaxID=206335 RepID=A0A9P5PHU4_9AGAR|nr:hypothetical protein BDP27DRAFT_1331320 [Rhodocollybia butyracea]
MQLLVRPQAPETLRRVCIVKFIKFLSLEFLLLVDAIPAATTSAPQPSVTLFVGDSTSTSGDIVISGGTTEIDATVVGVSTGSAGTETTYSVGEYFSRPATTIAVGGTSSGNTSGNFPFPSVVQTLNYTLVESSAGGVLILSNSIGVEVQSCSFASDGGPSANCVEVVTETIIETSPGATMTVSETLSTTFEATKFPITVLSVPTSTSSTSDAVKPRTGIRYLNWCMGGFVFMSWLL